MESVFKILMKYFRVDKPNGYQDKINKIIKFGDQNHVVKTRIIFCQDLSLKIIASMH